MKALEADNLKSAAAHFKEVNAEQNKKMQAAFCDKGIAFYEKALGLKEHHRKESSDGSFTLVYLTDSSTGFLLELTCLKEHPQAYELGENESHLCFRVSGDYDAIRQYHKENGWVCFENTAMGLYFINDPDDYWIEVLPEK